VKAWVAVAVAAALMSPQANPQTAESIAAHITRGMHRAEMAGRNVFTDLPVEEPAPATPRTVRVTRPPANVEAWRPLVAAYFPAGLVDEALAVLACESQGNPGAHNRSGASGLWQFMPDTWDWVAGNTGSPSFDEDGPYDPEWATINAAWLWQHGGPQHWTCWRMQQ